MSHRGKRRRVLLPFLTCCLSAIPGFICQAQSGAVSAAPNCWQRPTPIGAYLAPVLPGWDQESEQRPLFSTVYYRREAGGTRLLAKVLHISARTSAEPQSLIREKTELEAGLKAGDSATGEQSHLLTSRMVKYQGKSAIYLVRVVRAKGETTRVKSLIFNDGADQYQVTVYAHSLSPDVLKAADKGWQRLTAGLQKRV